MTTVINTTKHVDGNSYKHNQARGWQQLCYIHNQARGWQQLYTQPSTWMTTVIYTTKHVDDNSYIHNQARGWQQLYTQPSTWMTTVIHQHFYPSCKRKDRNVNNSYGSTDCTALWCSCNYGKAQIREINEAINVNCQCHKESRGK